MPAKQRGRNGWPKNLAEWVAQRHVPGQKVVGDFRNGRYLIDEAGQVRRLNPHPCGGRRPHERRAAAHRMLGSEPTPKSLATTLLALGCRPVDLEREMRQYAEHCRSLSA